MKSKTVAGILRHVASRISDVEGGGEGGTAAAPSEPSKDDAEADAAAEGDVVEQAIDPTPRSKRGKRETGPGFGGPGEDERLEKLYEIIAWPLGRQFGHPYDAFKLALT